MIWVRRVLFAAVIVALIFAGWQFVRLNDAPVTVDLYFLQLAEVPLWQVLLVSFGGGLLLMGLVSVYQGARSGLMGRRYRRKLGDLETEIHQLRNLPLAGESGAVEAPAGAEPDLDELQEGRAG